MTESPTLFDQKEVSGIVERITFHNPENGFCVTRLKVYGKKDLITLICQVQQISVGEFLQASGFWKKDKVHGFQFKAESVNLSPPDTIEGLEKYLSSPYFKGIGKSAAKKLLQSFGTQVLHVMENEPEKLKGVPGISLKQANALIQGLQEQGNIKKIMAFLARFSLGTSQTFHIYKKYGQEAIHIIRENPYQMIEDIPGIGFKTADIIALKLGLKKEAMERIRAGISFLLHEET